MRKVVLAGTVAVLTTCTFAATEVTWVGAVEKSRDTYAEQNSAGLAE